MEYVVSRCGGVVVRRLHPRIFVVRVGGEEYVATVTDEGVFWRVRIRRAERVM